VDRAVHRLERIEDLMTAPMYAVSLSQPARLRRAAILTWLELPRVAVVGLLWIALAVPLVSGLLGAPWLLVAFAALPSCLYATGLARFAAIITDGGRPRVRDAFQLDFVLGCTVEVAVVAVTALLAAGGAWTVPGALLTAVLLLVFPVALAYGAVRGRRGFSAWRGGLILVAFRPGSALTMLALNCIAGFVVVASLGILGVVVPCLLLVFACSTVGAHLDDIDRTSGTP
jgi:hypothetical protein